MAAGERSRSVLTAGASGPSANRLQQHTAAQLPAGAELEPHQPGQRRRDVGVADRRPVDEARLKSGPIAAMLLNVLSRPNPPCMPWPSCSAVSAICTAVWTSSGLR